MKEILFFDSMLTPKIITFVYWILLATVVISWLGTMFGGYGGFKVQGLFYTIGGAIGVRMGCELLIVLFKMNDALQELRNK